MNREILEFLKMNDVEHKESRSLAEISPIRIGGVADIIAFPDSEEKLARIAGFLWNYKIKHKIVGRMSNVLFKDDYHGVIIRTDRIAQYSVIGNILTVSCGASLPIITKNLCRGGLGGFEALSGIPGSVGGAILGNAGAFGFEISDRILTVRCFDYESQRTFWLSKSESDFAYRSSIFKSSNNLILSARFSLIESDCLSVKTKMNRYQSIRKSTQPSERSLGSTFKRPGENIFAARMIDECGLKGYTVGGAQISKKHAGFIINVGGATAADYINLSDFAADRVYDRFGVRLEREVEII